jgi:hypothetical protein
MRDRANSIDVKTEVATLDKTKLSQTPWQKE